MGQASYISFQFQVQDRSGMPLPASVWPEEVELKKDEEEKEEKEVEEEEVEDEVDLSAIFNLGHVGDTESDEDGEGGSEEELDFGSMVSFQQEKLCTLHELAPELFPSPAQTLSPRQHSTHVMCTPSPRKQGSPRPLFSSPLAALLAEIDESLPEDPLYFLAQGSVVATSPASHIYSALVFLS